MKHFELTDNITIYLYEDFFGIVRDKALISNNKFTEIEYNNIQEVNYLPGKIN